MNSAKAITIAAICLMCKAIGTSLVHGQTAPPITAGCLAPNELQFLLGSQKGLGVFQSNEQQPTAHFNSKLQNIHDLAFTNDGASLLVAGGTPAEQGTVEIWDWRERKLSRRLAVHQDVIYRVSVSRRDDSFCTASVDGTCAVLSAAGDKPALIYTGHSRPVLAVAYLNDGKQIVSAGVDQTLQCWDASTGQLLRKFDNHLATINDVAVRPDQAKEALSVVATASEDRTVRFWQPTIGRLVRFAKLSSAPRDITWDSAGKRVIAGCTDGRVRLIDYETAAVTELEQSLAGRIHTLLLVPDGVIVAGEGGKFARVQLPPPR